jgi:3-oxoacyl-[acyl-carrier protein] reductase
MISADLNGKTALVTGGASGVGLATVELLAKCGATVALNHRPSNTFAAPEITHLAKLGYRVIAAPGDIGKPEEAADMVNRAVDQLGRLDILVNNAGTPGAPAKGKRIDYRDLDALNEEWWDEVFSTNVVGAFRCIRAATPALKEARGSVVSVASVAGIGPVGSNMAYGTSKAGLIQLTTYLSRALAPEVRVNAVAPGFIDTPWTKAWPEEVKQGAIARTPLKRACTAEDIAEAILFLSAGGAMITGQTLIVDGGLL